MNPTRDWNHKNSTHLRHLETVEDASHGSLPLCPMDDSADRFLIQAAQRTDRQTDSECAKRNMSNSKLDKGAALSGGFKAPRERRHLQRFCSLILITICGLSKKQSVNMSIEWRR